MSTLRHLNQEPSVPFAPAAHTASVLDDALQQTTEAPVFLAEPQPAPRRISQRYKVTWAGIVSAVKWSDILIVAFGSLLMAGMGAAVTALLGTSFFASEILGTVLFVTVLLLKEYHVNQFTGRRPLSWLISWLFRATLWFAGFALLRVMRHKNLDILDEMLTASLVATCSIAWQYWRQSRRNRKAN